MEKRETEELFKGFEDTKNPESFLKENKNEFLKKGLQEHLNELAMAKGLTVAEVIKGSNLNKSTVYKMFDPKKKFKNGPGRDKVIAVAFGLGLSCGETSVLLKRTGYRALYARDKRDGLIIYAYFGSQHI